MPPSALSSRRWKSTSCEEERRSLKASWMSAVGAGLNWGSSGWAHCAMSDFDRQSLMLPGSSWDSSGAPCCNACCDAWLVQLRYAVVILRRL